MATLKRSLARGITTTSSSSSLDDFGYLWNLLEGFFEILLNSLTVFLMNCVILYLCHSSGDFLEYIDPVCDGNLRLLQLSPFWRLFSSLSFKLLYTNLFDDGGMPGYNFGQTVFQRDGEICIIPSLMRCCSGVFTKWTFSNILSTWFLAKAAIFVIKDLFPIPLQVKSCI